MGTVGRLVEAENSAIVKYVVVRFEVFYSWLRVYRVIIA